MYRWVPNALSVSRILLSPIIAVTAVFGRWLEAFLIFLIALATDWFDGWLAIRLDAKSEFGQKVVEPAADMALSAGALAGLFFTGTIPWITVWPLVALLLFIHSVIHLIQETRLIRRICNGAAPLYYLAVILATAGIYAWKALGISSALLAVPAFPLGYFAVKLKWSRVSGWLHGRS